MNQNPEWILANSKGSYASSTASFANTRTYHGLLVKTTNDHFSRSVLLSKLFETVALNGKNFSIDHNYYPGVQYPRGDEYLVGFSGFPVVESLYEVQGLKIRKRLTMHPTEDYVVLRYDFEGEKPDGFSLTPLLSFRSYHKVIRKGDRNFKVDSSENAVSFSSGDISLTIKSKGEFSMAPDWFFNVQYPMDQERGNNFEEDLYKPGQINFRDIPGFLEIPIFSGKDLNINFSGVSKLFSGNLSRYSERSNVVKSVVSKSTMLITDNNIMAGYHWFGPWGRDALISIPGLCLVTGRFDKAKNILNSYKNSAVGGMVPKRIEDDSDFRTVDTSLWFVYALHEYLRYSGDWQFSQKLLPFVSEILNTYITGNDMFKLDGPFVRTVTAPLTWMDAFFNEKAVTPRIGLPIEVNALWFNALETFKFLAEKNHETIAENILDMSLTLKEKFRSKFVKNNSILDVSDPDDASIRPNFLFAYSLPFNVMENFGDFRKIADEKLLTHFGLRTLSPDDPKFAGEYSGNQEKRDTAYHNGTVWPWLIGPYISAVGKSGMKVAEAWRYFSPLLKMQYIPEIFDGNSSGIPRGCLMQAWSYGEIMRVFHEYVNTHATKGGVDPAGNI